MNKRIKAILYTILDDIKANDPKKNSDAFNTLHNEVVSELLIEAGCPESILQAMKETISLSSVERRYCCIEIKKAIKKPRRETGF